MPNFQGVILDVDGTLVDSNDAHAQAWLEALEAEGFEVSFEQIRRLIGMGSDKLLPEVTGLSKDSPTGRRISQRRAEIFKTDYLPSLKPFPQTRELLQRLHDDGMELFVASSAEQDELGRLLEMAGATDLIQEKTSSDDAEHSKPDPDIVQATLGKMEYAPSEVVMLGDTPYDLQAAQKSGIALIALRCGGWTDPDLAGAIAIYHDPADLLAHYGTSPFGQNGGQK